MAALEFQANSRVAHCSCLSVEKVEIIQRRGETKRKGGGLLVGYYY